MIRVRREHTGRYGESTRKARPRDESAHAEGSFGRRREARAEDGDVERLADVLAAPRRRIVLEVLRTRRTATLEELAAAVVEAERRDGEAAGPDARLRTLWNVRLSHVPRLLEADLIRYDDDRELVVPTATTDLLFACVDRLETVGRPDRSG